MLYTEFDTEKYEELLINTAFDNPESLTNINKGHTKVIHVGQTDSQLLERIAKEDKNSVSSFTDLAEYPILSRIGDAIVNQATIIAGWACSKRNEFSDMRDYNRLTISVNLNYDEPIGTGFNDQLEKYVTDTIKVVLQRDMSGENSFGFYVLTAYPDIEKGIPTGEVYEENDIIKNNKNLSVLEKIKFGLRKDDVFSQIGIDKYTGTERLFLMHKISNSETYTAYINEENCRIMRRTLEKTSQISVTELRSSDSEMYKAIQKAEILKEVAIIARSGQNKTNVTCKQNYRAENLQH